MEQVPPLSAVLREDSKGAGGLRAVLSAIRFAADEPDIGAFLEKYDEIPSGDRESLPWEFIAISAGVNPSHLLGAIRFAVRNYSAGRVQFIISMGHPKSAAARVRFAQLAGGVKDRDAIDTMTGALPTAKGPTFIGKAIFGGAANTAAGKTDDDDDDEGEVAMFDSKDGDLDALFPPSNAMQEKLIPIRQKLLE